MRFTDNVKRRTSEVLLTTAAMTGMGQPVRPVEAGDKSVVLAQDNANQPSLKETIKGKVFYYQHSDAQGENGKPKPYPLDKILESPCYVIHGYGDCPLCEEITKVIAAVQKKLFEQGIEDVPIVVISVWPEKDRGKPEERLSDYNAAGVKQVNSDKPLLKSWGHLPPKDLNLHLVIPPSKEDAQAIQMAIAGKGEANTDPGLGADFTQHTRYITLCVDGKALLM